MKENSISILRNCGYYSLSIEAKRGSVNSTSHLNSGFVYVHVRETVPKPGRLLGLNTESRFSTL